MKAIIISIKPEWAAKILSYKKTIEIRKTMPKCEFPCEVYIYCSEKGNLKNCLYGFYESEKDFNNKKITYEVVNYCSGLEPLNGKVVAKFTLNKVEKVEPYKKWYSEDDYDMVYEEEILRKSCLIDTELEYYLYLKDGKGYAWYIDNLQIFDEPKKLDDFYKNCDSFLDCIKCKRKDKNSIGSCDKRINKAPQSWCYCEVED